MFFDKLSGFYHKEEADEEGNIKKEYRKVPGIKDPWEPDVTENYPREVIDKYGKKMEYWIKVEKQVLGPHYCQALRLDYSRNPSIELWKKIETILESNTPRGGVVPKPIVVGDESGWLISEDDIPSVNLSHEEKSEEAPQDKSSDLISRMKAVKA